MEMILQAANGTLAHKGEGTTVAPAAGEWAIEPKYDGWWLAAHVREDRVDFYARSGNRYNGRLKLIEAELLANFPADTVLAGEAVAIRMTPDGRAESDWGKAQSVLTTTKGVKNPFEGLITFMVFDLLAHGGLDIRSLGYAKRRAALERTINGKGMKRVALTPSFSPDKMTHAQLVQIGFEGSMWKRLDAPFASGFRGRGLLKWKHEATEDVVIMGFEAGRDVGAVVFGQFRDGELVRRGTFKRKPKLIPTPDLMTWAGKVIEIKHNGVMPSGALRHPSAMRIREDKVADQCQWT
jgi:bifunctional non-homologous end joining protein LigD